MGRHSVPCGCPTPSCIPRCRQWAKTYLLRFDGAFSTPFPDTYQPYVDLLNGPIEITLGVGVWTGSVTDGVRTITVALSPFWAAHNPAMNFLRLTMNFSPPPSPTSLSVMVRYNTFDLVVQPAPELFYDCCNLTLPFEGAVFSGIHYPSAVTLVPRTPCDLSFLNCPTFGSSGGRQPPDDLFVTVTSVVGGRTDCMTGVSFPIKLLATSVGSTFQCGSYVNQSPVCLPLIMQPQFGDQPPQPRYNAILPYGGPNNFAGIPYLQGFVFSPFNPPQIPHYPNVWMNFWPIQVGAACDNTSAQASGAFFPVLWGVSTAKTVVSCDPLMMTFTVEIHYRGIRGQPQWIQSPESPCNMVEVNSFNIAITE